MAGEIWARQMSSFHLGGGRVRTTRHSQVDTCSKPLALAKTAHMGQSLAGIRLWRVCPLWSTTVPQTASVSHVRRGTCLEPRKSSRRRPGSSILMKSTAPLPRIPCTNTQDWAIIESRLARLQTYHSSPLLLSASASSLCLFSKMSFQSRANSRNPSPLAPASTTSLGILCALYWGVLKL